MAPIRYSLHYEDYSEHLMSTFGKLLQMQSLVDMTLMCSSHTLRVHKAVLAASSTYFQDVLQKQNSEPLVILKMRFSVLKCLIEFMYCGKTQCLEENLDELVSAAQFLKVKGLSKVTREGLGITNKTELPDFTPPVVINRPPKSLFEDGAESIRKPLPGPHPEHSPLLRTSKDPVMRIPYDFRPGGDLTLGANYVNPPRFKPRRGRPSARRLGWESAPVLGKHRREQDARKTMHQLKNSQNRHMQDYMDRVTLSQAVNSICSKESANNYMNMDPDLLYSSSLLDSNITFSKHNDMGNETITSTYNATLNKNGSANDMGQAMSEYVTALKNAGLPTDLPILLESGDGSYINVNEQVLMDMVQSNEIQYEVIDQPNIIEKVSDPTEIKSIDELSKSIKTNEMLLNNKSMPSSIFDKEPPEFMDHTEVIHSLNEILPDNLEPFVEQENFVILPSSIPEGNNETNDNNDFSSIVNDMQFFSNAMSDDVKKYYVEPNKNSIDLCSTSPVVDTSFNISFLDSKPSHFESENMGPGFSPMHSGDLRRNNNEYDYGLMTQSDALECLMTPKRLEENIDSKEKPYKDSDILELSSHLESSGLTSNNYLSINKDDEIMYNKKAQSASKIVELGDNGTQLVDFEAELDDSLKNSCSNNEKYLSDLTPSKTWAAGGADKDNMLEDLDFNDSLENNEENYLIQSGPSFCNDDNVCKDLTDELDGKTPEIELEHSHADNCDEVDNIFDENVPLLDHGKNHLKRNLKAESLDKFSKRKLRRKKN